MKIHPTIWKSKKIKIRPLNSLKKKSDLENLLFNRFSDDHTFE